MSGKVAAPHDSHQAESITLRDANPLSSPFSQFLQSALTIFI